MKKRKVLKEGPLQQESWFHAQGLVKKNSTAQLRPPRTWLSTHVIRISYYLTINKFWIWLKDTLS